MYGIIVNTGANIITVFYRNYFAFISKDSGKFNCHVFLENEVGLDGVQ